MRALHRTMAGLTLAVLFALAVGGVGSGIVAASTQHGHAEQADAMDPAAHYDAMAERLSLTAAQRETLAEPFHAAFAAMQELHRLHGVIAEELSDEQRHELAAMVHEMMGAMGGRHGEADHDGSRHH